MNIFQKIKINIRTTLVILLAISISTSPTLSLQAAVPAKSLAFHGQLSSGGSAVSGSKSISFQFYDALSAGSTVGSAIVKTVTVTNGYFSAVFDASDISSVNFNQSLWIGVTVEGDVLSPRLSINPVSSSLNTYGVYSYASAPAVGLAGALYYNTGDSKTYVSNGSAWVELGGSQWTTTGSDIYYTTGNIGVGTTTPGSKLVVSGQAVADNFVSLSTTATSTFAGPVTFATHCITADTRFRRRRKNASGEEVDEDVDLIDLEVGDFIESFDEATQSVVYRKINSVFIMGNKSIIKIDTTTGYSIKTTEEHPYYVKRGNEDRGSWVKVKDLFVGNNIAVVDLSSRAVIFDTVSAITNLPEEEVFDLEIEGTHTFIANNIVAHNTYVTGGLGVGVLNTSAGTFALKQAGTNAVILGDVSGNARGTSAIDVQSGRTLVTQVASGVNASAFGYSNTASDYRSSALGYCNTASGYQSSALGYCNTASGFYSSALGYLNTASGYQSSALGYLNTASGCRSSAFGYNNTASSCCTSAFGRSNNALGSRSSAFGRANTSSTSSSAFGNANTASGTSSSAFGNANTASGCYSSALGYLNTASGCYSSVLGYCNTGSTINSTVVGRSNFTSTGGLGSVVIGLLNNATGATLTDATGVITGTPSATSTVGYSSTALGICNLSEGNFSTAVGYRNTASGCLSSAFGSCLTNSTASSTMIGFNTSWLNVLSTGQINASNGACLTVGGVWTSVSDRNLKENFVELDKEDILTKINTLPLTKWNYKSEDSSIMHIGPVAQDFYGIFGLGDSDKSISTIDPAGIALVGVQALSSKIDNLYVDLGLATSSVGIENEGGVISWIKALGATVVDNVAHFVNVIVGKLTVSDLTIKNETDVHKTGYVIYDRMTGQPLCVFFENGIQKTEPGDCDTPSPVPNLGDSNASSGGSTEGGTNENSSGEVTGNEQSSGDEVNEPGLNNTESDGSDSSTDDSTNPTPDTSPAGTDSGDLTSTDSSENTAPDSSSSAGSDTSSASTGDSSSSSGEGSSASL